MARAPRKPKAEASPEPQGAPHPRTRSELFGHAAAERTLLEAIARGRLHHAWLVTGPAGIGKATLAYRLARHLMAADEAGAGRETLAVDPQSAVHARIAARGHGNLLALERELDERTGKPKGTISVDEVRRLTPFFGLSGAETGYRIAIVDKADDLTQAAANALLKTLEEPPPRGLLILIADAPGQLLPTIRSRCRQLALRPLGLDDFRRAMDALIASVPESVREGLPEIDDWAAFHAQSGGAPGAAWELLAEGGLALRAALESLLARMAGDGAAAGKGGGPSIADFVAGFAQDRDGARFAAFGRELDDILASAIRRGIAGAAGSGALRGAAVTLAPATAANREAWLAYRERTRYLFERTDAVHLDRRAVAFTILSELEATLAATASRR